MVCPRIIYAQHGHQQPPVTAADGSDVYLNDTHVYDFVPEGGPDDTASDMQQIIVPTGSRSVGVPEYSAVAAGTFSLAASSNAGGYRRTAMAAVHAALNACCSAFSACRSAGQSRRQSKYAKMGTAILIYSGYYLLCTSARTWVQHGTVGAFPGIWWAPALAGGGAWASRRWGCPA